MGTTQQTPDPENRAKPHLLSLIATLQGTMACEFGRSLRIYHFPSPLNTVRKFLSFLEIMCEAIAVIC